MITIQIGEKPDLSVLPLSPGVYLYHDEENKIIYVGKARSLRTRVKNYFNSGEQSAKTRVLVSKIRKIEWIVVDNEVEALLLENNLIKKYSPRYNISLKDSKTYAYIKFSSEPYPRISSTRKLTSSGKYFGPYTDGQLRRDLLKIIPKIFRIADCTHNIRSPCLNYHLNRCINYYIQHDTEEEYASRVRAAQELLKGKSKEVIKTLEEEMQKASIEKKYETALEKRKQIEAIKNIEEKQKVSLIKNYDQDVFALVLLGQKAVIEMFSITKGVIQGKKEYLLENEPQVFEEFIKRYYSLQSIPEEIVVNAAFWEDEENKKILEDYLAKLRGARVVLVCPERGEKRQLVELAEKNALSKFGEAGVLKEVQDALNLPNLPNAIECFDISNLGYDHVVGGMVRYVNAKPDKSGYRKFKIKSITNAQDDFGSISEVVQRRYSRLLEEKKELPGLIIIDGGKGQLSAAVAALRSLNLKIPIIALAKEHEEIYVPMQESSLRFDSNSKMMLFIRGIRDETHRFTIGYNRKRRQMHLRESFKR